MIDSDILEFTEAWNAAHELDGNKRPSDTAVLLAFKILSSYEMEDVKQGIIRHMADPQRGRYRIKPADVIAQIQAARDTDGRPTGDEAWATALQACDEHNTVIWTDEMATAWAIAKPILDAGDKIGARMAFRQAYEREVAQARESRRPVKWTPSLGLDQGAREAAIERAIERGQLPASSRGKLLPPPITDDGTAVAGLLTGSAPPAGASTTIRRRLNELQQAIKKAPELSRAEARRMMAELREAGRQAAQEGRA